MATVLCVGHAVQDFVFSVPEMPRAAHKHRATRFESVGGGPAATAAVAIAALGGRALLAARVGEDAAATMIGDELEACGVDCSWLRRCAGCASSVSAVLVDARGERMIVNHLDARLPPGADWLPQPRAVGADAVLADTRWPLGALCSLAAAREAGLPAVLDADMPIPADGAVLRAATHVAFSADALRDFTGQQDAGAALLGVARDLDAWCCVTVGGEGVLFAAGGRLLRLEAHAVAVIDTLGAGDVWHGAFALALAERCGEVEAMVFASAAAALKVQRSGGRKGVPTRGEVEQFMAARGSSAPVLHEV